MAKKVKGFIKLQIPAGKANPAPPVGPALGQHGVNIMEFCKAFNASTQDKGDLIIPVVITVHRVPLPGMDRPFQLPETAHTRDRAAHLCHRPKAYTPPPG